MSGAGPMDASSAGNASSAGLERRAMEITRAAQAGARWLEQNGARLRIDAAPLGETFRRFARRANRLRVAASRPMAVAVFGASQAGKSYLVSSLAAPRGKPLLAQYGAQTLNFLRDLNPEGGKESTGLVSRFTIRNIPTPAQAPVPLRLLSQTDVVKILANTFLEDFQLTDPRATDPEAVAALFDRLEAQIPPGVGPMARDGVTRDDIEELREYFDLYFRAKPLLRELGAAYWTRAAALIPRLPAELRAQAYAPLWGGTAAFTTLAASLISVLARLEHAEMVFCGADALLRRGGNLLDAASVLGLGTSSPETIQVTLASGVSVILEKAPLTALIAEVTVPLPERPWDFFAHTDLLDFPGARSRKENESVEQALAGEHGLGELFLRGKVAYLFQRYNAEQEIAAMLLCVGPSVQEVSTLPGMVTRWIHQTMGATPADRADQRTSLFFVLTKFDTELDGKHGEDVATGQRWANRLHASLIEPFGSHQWPLTWAPNKPFNNVFWLRSPAVPLALVYDYAADGTETLTGRGTTFLAERQRAYLDNELVRRHFADPARAWQAALEANDGGVGYLAERLAPICDSALKLQQIAGRVTDLAREINAQLRPYYHTGDLVAELEQARTSAREVVRALIACAQAQKFGPLLRALQTTTDDVTAVYWDRQMRIEDGGPPLSRPIGAAGTLDDYDDELAHLLDDPLAQPDVIASDRTGPGRTGAARDAFAMLADVAVEEWARNMAAVASETGTETAFRMPRPQLEQLVRAIERAARRLDLRGDIAARLRRHASFLQRSASAARKPVMVTEEAINHFVYMLGFDRLAPAQRPEVPRVGRRIFAPRMAATGLPQLGDERASYDRTFHVDWMIAIAQAFEDNVQDARSSGLDIAANQALGGILAQLGGHG